MLSFAHLSEGAVGVGQISLADSQEVNNRGLPVLISKVKWCAAKAVLHRQLCLVSHQPLDTLQVTSAEGREWVSGGSESLVFKALASKGIPTGCGNLCMCSRVNINLGNGVGL